MPILSGSASLTRFNVPLCTKELPFDDYGFREIPQGSERRESIGFVPFEPDAEYRVGTARHAFRVRIDKLAPDPTRLKERVKQLLATDMEETGFESVSARRRRELKNLAVEELIGSASPKSQITECVIDGQTLHVGSSSNAVIGRITNLLRKVGVVADFKTPWLDAGDPDQVESEIMEVREPGQSLLGSRFLQNLMGDPDLVIEPVDGYAKLQTERARVALNGEILRDLHEHVREGCELLAVKLVASQIGFRLDALPFRISGLSLPSTAGGHWTAKLDERLEQIDTVWELLERKFDEFREQEGPFVGQASLKPGVEAAKAFRDSIPAGQTVTISSGGKSVTVSGDPN